MALITPVKGAHYVQHVSCKSIVNNIVLPWMGVIIDKGDVMRVSGEDNTINTSLMYKKDWQLASRTWSLEPTLHTQVVNSVQLAPKAYKYQLDKYY